MYLKDNYEVIINHTDPKSILDILRTSCKYEEEPIKKLCALMNKETKDGYKMDKYSKLLKAAVNEILNLEEQNDLAFIFKVGSDALFDNKNSGLDDFELITFVVVK